MNEYRNRQNGSYNLQSAELRWQAGEPVSVAFDDVYFSRDNGLEESRHVFLQGNNLQQRWQQLKKDSSFTIIETGFGTGLNFLAAVQLWFACAPPDALLHFVSAEKFPLHKSDLALALSPWSEITNLSQELVEHYPEVVPGFHRRWLFSNRVCLTLIFDDAAEGFKDLQSSDEPNFARQNSPKADAWFLDGFAPAKNPGLWSTSLFEQVARLSASGTTAATFTVARIVRDGLINAGFTYTKTPGFGRKREMLHARCEKTHVDDVLDKATTTRVEKRDTPWHISVYPPAHPKKALIIGAGIAGCSTAWSLRQRGWDVTLIERHGTVATEASGNPQGILYPKLSLQDLALSLYARQALCHSMDFYRFAWENHLGKQCGILVLPETDKELQAFPQIAARYGERQGWIKWVEGNELRDIAGIALESPSALYFPHIGWVDPKAICSYLTQQITLRQAEVKSLLFDATHPHWTLLDANEQVIDSAPVVVLANSHQVSGFTQTSHLPLRCIRGQITAIPTSPASAELKAVICGTGYIAPSAEGLHTLGATYGLDEQSTDIRAEDHRENIRNLIATDSRLGGLLDASVSEHPEQLTGRAAIRCTTPDYLPLAGPAPVFEEMLSRFAPLRRNAKARVAQTGAYWPGLWINCGHGSRGLTYAPLASELIASQINGDPSPLPRILTQAVNPARFIIRQLKRNQL